MAAIWSRINTLLLLLVLFALLTVMGMLATGVHGGPLDPLSPPSSTESVRLPGTPISSAPITITTAGHYYVTRNLSVAGAVVAININASDVTLDLGGFTVDGSDAVGSYGIAISGERSDIRIEDGVIKDFHVGIGAAGDIRVTIDAVHVVSNIRGLEPGHSNVVTNCVASENSEMGMWVSGVQSVIRGCVVQDNGAEGIRVVGERNMVELSIVDTNDGGDIRDIPAHDGPGNVYRGNAVGGITLSLNGSATVVDNVCQGNIVNPGGNVVGPLDHANAC